MKKEETFAVCNEYFEDLNENVGSKNESFIFGKKDREIITIEMLSFPMKWDDNLFPTGLFTSRNLLIYPRYNFENNKCQLFAFAMAFPTRYITI